MQKIGDLIGDLITLGIFIYLILLINGKVKLSAGNQEKFDAMLDRRRKWIKFLAYGGAIIFVGLLVIRLMGL